MGLKAIRHAGSEHADHLVGFTIQPDLLADDLWVVPEALMPKQVSHDHAMFVAHLAFFGQKVSSERKADSLQLEESRRCDSGLQRFWTVVIVREAESSATPGNQVLKDGVLALPFQVVGSRNRVAMSVGPIGPHHDELFGIWKGQRGKQRGINDAEDGSICADSNGECEHCHGSEARALPEDAESKAQISQKKFQKRQTAAVAVILFRLLHAAKFHERVASCGFERHSRAKIVFEVELEVALQFFRKFGIALRFAGKTEDTLQTRAKPSPYIADAAHVEGSAADRNFARMACACCQSRASRSNCFRPARVSL